VRKIDLFGEDHEKQYIYIYAKDGRGILRSENWKTKKAFTIIANLRYPAFFFAG
jgi:hypothetical protein